MDIIGNILGSKMMRIAFVICIWALIYLPRLGAPEVDYNEVRRIYPSEKMMETGNFAIPEWEGMKYFRKPPLMNWLIVGSCKLLGSCDEFSSRLPNAISILALCIFVLICPSGFLDTKGRFLFSLLLLTTVCIIQKHRICEIDSIYMVFTGMATLLWLNLYSLNKRGFYLWLPSATILGGALLLKGPLALLVYYVVVVSVLHIEKRLGELFSVKHFISVALMLAIFGVWLYFVYSSPFYQQDIEALSGTWTKEIFSKFNPSQMEFLKWGRKIAGALAGMLPWLLLIPVIRIKSLDAPQKQRHLNSALFKSIIILSCIILIMPGLKVRYLLPVYPLVILYVASNLAYLQSKTVVEVWKTALFLAALLLPAVYFLGMLVFGLLPFLSGLDCPYSQEMKALCDSLSPFDYVAIVFGFAVVLFYVWVFMLENDVHDLHRRVVLTAVAATACMMFYHAFAIPTIRLGEEVRPMAAIINSKVPEDVPLKMFNVGLGEPFLFYLDSRPREYVEEKDTLFKTHGEYILLPTANLPDLEKSGQLAKGNYHIIAELTKSEHRYSLIKYLIRNKGGDPKKKKQ
jgi:4-amino-4-deoxy-L-arabinose transferase-like glycosyltransferase